MLAPSLCLQTTSLKTKDIFSHQKGKEASFVSWEGMFVYSGFVIGIGIYPGINRLIPTCCQNVDLNNNINTCTNRMHVLKAYFFLGGGEWGGFF